MSLPSTVEGVVARLREIDSHHSASDGVAVFNRMYLTVTEHIADGLSRTDAATVRFRDAETMAALDVGFAGLWLAAYDDDSAGRRVVPAWRPLFEARRAGRLPVQYAIAGMNAHIEHDLPIAVVETCRERGLEPEAIRGDYEIINVLLAQVESGIRRSFLDALGRELDDHSGRWSTC